MLWYIDTYKEICISMHNMQKCNSKATAKFDEAILQTDDNHSNKAE